MKPENTLSKPSQGIKHVEALLLSVLDTSAQLVIGGLTHTQHVLDHAEMLAKRLVNLERRASRLLDESRHLLKNQALDWSRDLTEVEIEMVRGTGQVLKTVVDELQELKHSGSELFQDILEPALDLPNPFRPKAALRKNGKEPTIIPISIQDN